MAFTITFHEKYSPLMTFEMSAGSREIGHLAFEFYSADRDTDQTTDEIKVAFVRVEEEYRGQGLSEHLYQALLDWCRQNNIRLVWGDVIHPAAGRVREKVFGPPSQVKAGRVFHDINA